MIPEPKQSTTTFTYHDPSRNFEGTPYEAASKSVVQTRNVLRLMARALSDTKIQARNAYMSRRLDTGHETAGAIHWPEAAEAGALEHVEHRLALIENELLALDKKLKAITMAVSYDPKHPPLIGDES